jgi:hypothetical protein
MIKQEEPADTPDELPAPIQLTPDQLVEVSGGSLPNSSLILRRGLPQVA